MNRKLLVFVAIGAVLVVLPLLAKLTRGDSAKAVEAATVQAQQIRSSVLSSGRLAYREEVQLRSEVIGKAARVPVAEGDRVAAGDLIVALDPEQFRTLVDQQRANTRLQEIAIERQRLLLANLERQVDRTRELFRRGLTDTNTQEAAENELALARVDLRSREEALAQARAALAQAEDNLGKTEIRSPIDGIVIQLDVKPGEAVIAGTTNIPGSTLAVIADTSSMLTELRVDEADIAQVALGQSAAIFAAAFPDTALPGLVESIATSAQRAEGQQNLSFEVRVRLTEPDRVAVRPGMSCRAEIYTETSEDALAVPIQAVLYDEQVDEGEEQAHVFLVDNGLARRRNVETGLSSDSHMEIVSGLAAGDRVVSGPFRMLRNLRDGDRVKVEDKVAGNGKAP
ncbi:MAG TPA: efflux RND transporter periplasmic adaptor subunit [Xanthomonadaceae bacterium]|nr:efflux RND transporter periplasmic adaptor subunit [Xanthomonadaceae bacterium]